VLPPAILPRRPCAASGAGFFGGCTDDMNLINIRDGGVNGVTLTWDECETEYAVEKAVECYQRRLESAVGGHCPCDD